MCKRIIIATIAFLCVCGLSGCEKGSMYPPMDVTGKFVMIQKSERFKAHGHTVKAYLYERKDTTDYYIERCITGYIPSVFRSYDTINIKATLIHVAPEFEYFYIDSTKLPDVHKLENIEKI